MWNNSNQKKQGSQFNDLSKQLFSGQSGWGNDQSASGNNNGWGNNEQSGWNQNPNSGWNSGPQSNQNQNNSNFFMGGQQQNNWGSQNNHPSNNNQNQQNFNKNNQNSGWGYNNNFPPNNPSNNSGWTSQNQQKFNNQGGQRRQDDSGNKGWQTTPQSNPYAVWDQVPIGQDIQKKKGQFIIQKQHQNDSLFALLNLTNQVSTFTNPIFQKPLRKQQFPDPFIRYKIIPVLDDKKALDVTSVQKNSKKLKKNNLIIWDYHGGPNQLFYFIKRRQQKGNDLYSIINVARGFTVEVPESQSKSGIQMYANPRNDTENELWKLKKVKQGRYQIVNCFNKVLDLQNQASKNGTKVIQWQSNGGKNQQWRIVPA